MERLIARNSGRRTDGDCQTSAQRKTLGIAIDGPQRAVVPPERFADRFENSWHRLGERRRFDQRACHEMLGGEAPLRDIADAQRVRSRAWLEGGL